MTARVAVHARDQQFTDRPNDVRALVGPEQVTNRLFPTSLLDQRLEPFVSTREKSVTELTNQTRERRQTGMRR